MDDARDVEMELLGALGGDEETRAESASLDARGPPVKLEMYPTTAEDDLLEEVEAMERISAHKPARQTPLMSLPMKHEPEEGDAMEIDLKVRTTQRLLYLVTQLNTVLFFASTAIHALSLPRYPPALAGPLAQFAAHSANPNPPLRTALSTYLGLTLPSSHTVSRTHAYYTTCEPPRPVPTCPSHCQHQERHLEEHGWSRQSDRGNFQESHRKGVRGEEEAEPPERQ